MDVADHLKIMNDALAMIGAPPIGDEDEDSDLARQVSAVYYPKIDAMLSLLDWSFASKTFKLDAIAKIVANEYDAAGARFVTGWPHAFAMPGNRLSAPLRVMTDPRRIDMVLREFFLEQDRLYADAANIWAAFTVRAAPHVWKPDFRLAATKAIAADLCVPISHDAGLAATLRAEAEGSPEFQGRGGLIGRAMGADAAASQTKTPIWQDPLTSAHLS